MFDIHIGIHVVYLFLIHDVVFKWNHFPRYWPFVRGIHWSPVDSPHKDQWLGALVLSLICAWTNGWAKNRDAGDLRRHRYHYDVTVIYTEFITNPKPKCSSVFIKTLLWMYCVVDFVPGPTRTRTMATGIWRSRKRNRHFWARFKVG